MSSKPEEIHATSCQEAAISRRSVGGRQHGAEDPSAEKAHNRHTMSSHRITTASSTKQNVALSKTASELKPNSKRNKLPPTRQRRQQASATAQPNPDNNALEKVEQPQTIKSSNSVSRTHSASSKLLSPNNIRKPTTTTTATTTTTTSTTTTTATKMGVEMLPGHKLLYQLQLKSRLLHADVLREEADNFLPMPSRKKEAAAAGKKLTQPLPTQHIPKPMVPVRSVAEMEAELFGLTQPGTRQPSRANDNEEVFEVPIPRRQ